MIVLLVVLLALTSGALADDNREVPLADVAVTTASRHATHEEYLSLVARFGQDAVYRVLDEDAHPFDAMVGLRWQSLDLHMGMKPGVELRVGYVQAAAVDRTEIPIEVYTSKDFIEGLRVVVAPCAERSYHAGYARAEIGVGYHLFRSRSNRTSYGEGSYTEVWENGADATGALGFGYNLTRRAAVEVNLQRLLLHWTRKSRVSQRWDGSEYVENGRSTGSTAGSQPLRGFGLSAGLTWRIKTTGRIRNRSRN
ncbi:MAG: hypothetical protein JSU73_13920 [candidate division WOR-3 bacterium]|nr:MAG: hypothetical protein JSU73_13920 [candidate division WOR-3 bacterium]